MKLLIADCLSKIDDKGYPSGHYIHFFTDMAGILQKEFTVDFGCSKEYQVHLEGTFFDLGPSTKIKYENTIHGKLLNKIRHYIKMRRVLKSNYDFIIVQSGYLAVQSLALLFSKRNNVFLVIHEDLISHNMIKRLLYRWAVSRIRGIITVDPELAQVYGANTLVVPDYFNREVEECNCSLRYDVAMLGVINRIKDAESVVEAFAGTRYKVLIAGYFEHPGRYRRLLEQSSASNNIEIINRYLARDEYDRYMRQSKYIILPYLSSNYKSSGILHEALFKLKPVIVSSTPFLDLVKKENLGFQYQSSPAEIIDRLDDSEAYASFVKSIKAYILHKNANVGQRILDFFENFAQKNNDMEKGMRQNDFRSQ